MLVIPDEIYAQRIAGHVKEIINLLGENVNRSGLAETPDRVARALMEMTSGYDADVPALLKLFDSEDDELVYNQMVVMSDIPFTSMCEHHMQPFAGVAHVGYLPAGGRVVGLSKLVRVVDAFAARLQVQERLTQQVAEALFVHASAKYGAACVVEASHGCMECRGVRRNGITTTTSALYGEFEKPEVRAEFLQLIAMRRRR